MQGLLKLFTGVILLASCAKEQKYDKVFIQNVESHHKKSKIEKLCNNPQDPCVYVPSVAETPYNVTASRPFWLGEEKEVIIQLTEKELQIMQLDPDARFQDNSNNLSPVLSFGIAHKDYQCKEDEFGDCSNEEEEDVEKPWNRRRFVQIDTASFDVKERNSLPIDLAELFNAGCFSVAGKEMKNFIVDDESINITLRKTYNAKANCMPVEKLEDLRYLTFIVDYNYSIVKKSSLIDPKYKKVQYPQKDESHFGFFKTVISKKTVDGHDHVMGTKEILLNRWSPNKKIITYYLNSDFYLPEMSAVKDATFVAIDSVNQSLKKANANLQIKLENGSNKNPGDIRNNFIILVKDPQASGVIGYGPSIVDTQTGEIINARTVMYHGTMKKFLSRAYDELVEEIINEEIAREAGTVAETDTDSSRLASNDARGSSLFANKLASAQILDVTQMLRHAEDMFGSSEQNQAPLTAQSAMELMKQEKSMLERWSKETFYHASNMNFGDAVRSAIKKDLETNEGKVKFWDQLSEIERDAYLKILTPYVWVPTLIHEFGHNLGLRHNFHGSFDKDNHYTHDENVAMGLTTDSTYSSIMDYAYATINELPIMGKYDIAALKFAYDRSVDVIENGTIKTIPIASTIKETLKANDTLELKEYAYCSDEHVGSDPTCNRFDEGTSHSEIASHFVNTYKKNFEKRNLRGRRFSFEARKGDFQYASSTFSTFINLRNFFESYDMRVTRGSYNSPAASTNKLLQDIKKASDITFDFFMETLNAPAYHCIVADKATGQITQIAPFSEVAKDTRLGRDFGITTDIRFGCLYLNSYGDSSKMYLEFGNHFNNALDFTVDRDAIQDDDTSQIDVRGNWIDKAFASFFISARFSSPTTIGASAAGNYFDHPHYKEKLDQHLWSLLSNSYSQKVVARDIKGKRYQLTVPLTFDNNHVVNKSYNRVVNALFDLEHNRKSFKDIELKTIIENTMVDKNGRNTETIAKELKIVSIPLSWDLNNTDFAKIIQFKDESNKVTHRFGLTEKNIFGLNLAILKENIETLAKLTPEEIAASLESEEGIKPELAAISKTIRIDYLSGRVDQGVLLNSFMALAQ